MSQLTPHLGLKKPDGSDPFLRQDFDDNYDVLDAAPGIYICTSSTHPTTWGDNQVGRGIIEVDTGAILYFRDDHTFQASLASGSTDVGTLTTTVTALQSQVNGMGTDVAKTPNAQLSHRYVNSTINNGQTITYDVFGGSLPAMYFRSGGDILIWGHVGIAADGLPGSANYISYDVTVDGTGANWGDPGRYSHAKFDMAGPGTGTTSGTIRITESGTWRIDIPYMTHRAISAGGSHTMRVAITNNDTGTNTPVTLTHIKAVAVLAHTQMP